MKKHYLIIGLLSIFLPSSGAFGQLNKAAVTYNGQGSESIISIHFISEQLGFAGGKQGYSTNLTPILLKTIDGGDNWQHVALSRIEGTIAYLHFTDENTGYASTFQPAHFWRTTDGGSTWSEIDPLISANGYYDIHFTSSSTGFLLAMKVMNSKPKTIILRTTNGGGAWAPMDTLNGFGYIFDWADEINAAVIDLHYLRYTNNAWLTMDSIPVNQSKDVAFVNADTLYFSESPNEFSVFANKSVTGKGSITGASDAVPFIAFINSERGIAVGELGKIYVTENGGSSWTRISYSSENNLEEVIFTNFNNAFAVSSKTSSNNQEAGRIVKIYDSTKTSVGVQEMAPKGSLGITVFPNPLHQDNPYLNLSMQLQESGTLNIYGSKGKLLKTVQVNRGEETSVLYLPDLAPGLYFLQLKANGNVYHGKIVVE